MVKPYISVHVVLCKLSYCLFSVLYACATDILYGSGLLTRRAALAELGVFTRVMSM